jgi:hypothetical protein
MSEEMEALVRSLEAENAALRETLAAVQNERDMLRTRLNDVSAVLVTAKEWPSTQ